MGFAPTGPTVSSKFAPGEFVQHRQPAVPLASASWMEVGATSHGLTGAVSPFGKVTNLRPLRRLIWIGTDRVNLPSLV